MKHQVASLVNIGRLGTNRGSRNLILARHASELADHFSFVTYFLTEKTTFMFNMLKNRIIKKGRVCVLIFLFVVFVYKKIEFLLRSKQLGLNKKCLFVKLVLYSAH